MGGRKIFSKKFKKALAFSRMRDIIKHVAEVQYRCEREYADVAELADALDSGSSGSDTVGVQVPSSAPETRLIEPGFSFVFTQRSAKELLSQLPYHYRCRPGTAGHIAVVMQSQHHGLRAGQQQEIGATRRYKRGSGFGINPISKPWASLLRWGNLKIPLLFQHCGYRVPDSISALFQLNTGLIHQPDLTGFICHAGHQRNGLTILEPPFKGKKGCHRQNAVFARLTGFPLWPPLALRPLLSLRPPATATARAGPRATAPFLPAFLSRWLSGVKCPLFPAAEICYDESSSATIPIISQFSSKENRYETVFERV